MAHFGPKIKKTETADKAPYTVYYPHTVSSSERQWIQPYYQVVSIDPARKNYAIRIERRYHNGWITPIVFDKTSIESVQQNGEITIYNTYQELTYFLNKYESFYNDCHFIVIERQLPQNYKTLRIAQHTISYFSLKLYNKPLYPSIVEIDPRLKGKILGAPKGINDKQLKTWAVEKARELLKIRLDTFSLQVLDYFRNKQDDLSDTICQVEALFICWGFLPTGPPPITGPDDTSIQNIKPITLELTPAIIIPDLDNFDHSTNVSKLPLITPLTSSSTTVQVLKSPLGSRSVEETGSLISRVFNVPIPHVFVDNNTVINLMPTPIGSRTQQNKIVSIVHTAPTRIDTMPRAPVTHITLPTNPTILTLNTGSNIVQRPCAKSGLTLNIMSS